MKRKDFVGYFTGTNFLFSCIWLLKTGSLFKIPPVLLLFATNQSSLSFEGKRESWLSVRSVFPLKRDWFLHWILKWLSGRYLDIGWVGINSSPRANQLSETNVYPHWSVNKSITARFKNYGIYWAYRRFSIGRIVVLLSENQYTVVSAKFKSSSNTMVYVAGIFHLAFRIITETNLFF